MTNPTFRATERIEISDDEEGENVTSDV